MFTHATPAGEDESQRRRLRLLHAVTETNTTSERISNSNSLASPFAAMVSKQDKGAHFVNLSKL